MTRRQFLFVVAKIAFAAGILAYLLHKVGAARVWDSVVNANLLCIAGGIFLALVTVLISGWRWHGLLRVLGIQIAVLPLACVVLIGQFFLMFLPGPVGDDFTRMLYISRLAKGRAAEACTTVLLDRVIGLAAVLVVALLCIPWQWHLLAGSPQTWGLALGMLVGGSGVWLCGLLFFIAGHPTHRWFEHRLRSLPAFNFRDELATMWGLYCLNKRAVASVVAAACLAQLLICLLFSLAGTAVGISLPFYDWLTFVPIVLAANAIPVTVAGLGIREYLLILFLGVLGHVGTERALAASFVVFTMLFGLSLCGGLVYIFYRPGGALPPADSQGEGA